MLKSNEIIHIIVNRPCWKHDNAQLHLTGFLHWIVFWEGHHLAWIISMEHLVASI